MDRNTAAGATVRRAVEETTAALALAARHPEYEDARILQDANDKDRALFVRRRA